MHYLLKKHTIILKVHSTELINYLKNNSLVLGNKIKNKAKPPPVTARITYLLAGAVTRLTAWCGARRNRPRSRQQGAQHSDHRGCPAGIPSR